MSDQKNKPDQQDRRNWIDGQFSPQHEDELARRAKRGRQHLPDADAAGDFLAELDAAIDAAYGAEAAPENEDEGATIRSINRPRARRRWLGIAASVAILLAFGSWLVNRGPTPDSAALSAAYFTHFPNDLVVRTMGEGGTVEEELAAAFSAYTAEDYEQATTDLSDYLLNQPAADSSVCLYLGISQLKTEQFTAAKTNLLVARNLGYQTDAANWYLALTALGEGDIAEAKIALSTLKSGPSLFREKANQLLKELE